MNSINFAAINRYLEQFLTGALQTLWITVVTFCLVFALAVVVAVARFHRGTRVSYAAATVYVELLRNVPALVVLYLVYFGLPQFGLILNNYVAGILVLAIVIAAYLGESLKGSLAAVPRGQWEASASLGLGYLQLMRSVVLPQVVRNSWPVLVNHLMIVLFATSLLSVIDVRELASAAAAINSRSFRPFEVYVEAIVVYLLLAGLLQLVAAAIRRTLREPVAAALARSRRLRWIS